MVLSFTIILILLNKDDIYTSVRDWAVDQISIKGKANILVLANYLIYGIGCKYNL